MAGGGGSRLGDAEKPLAALRGRPLISYVIAALLGSRRVGHIYVALSPKVPGTADYVRASCDEGKVTIVSTPGGGYVEDMACAARALGLSRPFLVISSDLPLVRPEDVDGAIERYEASGAEALSVRVDAACLPPGLEPDTVLTDGGMRTVPAGINIVDGGHMDRAQRELVLVVREGRLAANVNYPKDLALCEQIMDGQAYR